MQLSAERSSLYARLFSLNQISYLHCRPSGHVLTPPLYPVLLRLAPQISALEVTGLGSGGGFGSYHQEGQLVEMSLRLGYQILFVSNSLWWPSKISNSRSHTAVNELSKDVVDGRSEASTIAQ